MPFTFININNICDAHEVVNYYLDNGGGRRKIAELRVHVKERKKKLFDQNLWMATEKWFSACNLYLIVWYDTMNVCEERDAQCNLRNEIEMSTIVIKYACSCIHISSLFHFSRPHWFTFFFAYFSHLLFNMIHQKCFANIHSHTNNYNYIVIRRTKNEAIKHTKVCVCVCAATIAYNVKKSCLYKFLFVCRFCFAIVALALLRDVCVRM